MKTLSQLLKVGSIATVVLLLLSQLFAHTDLLSEFRLPFDGNIRFEINIQTLLFLIQHFILIFFFIVLILDKANDRKIMIASGAGIFGVLLYMSYIPLFLIINQLPNEVAYREIFGTTFFSLINTIRYSLAVLLIIAGFVLTYVFSARKERMMLPLIIVVAVKILSYIVGQFLWRISGFEVCRIASQIIDILLPLSYAFMMFMYAYDIDNPQPKKLQLI